MGKVPNSEIDQTQQINFLKKISFFSDFDDHELAQFLVVSKWLKVPKGTRVIEEGAVERVFYILVRGEVSVFKTINEQGDVIELTTLQTGDCFGEMALVCETKRTAGVQTIAESYILRVEPEIISTSNVFLQLKFYKRFCEIVVGRLALANKRMVIQGAADSAAAPKVTNTPVIKKVKKPKAPMPPPWGAKGKPKKQTISLADLPPLPDKKERRSKAIIKKNLLSDQVLAINPAVAASIFPYLASDTANTRALTDLLYLEPALSAKVLKVANSSLYRRSCSIATVPHAIISVGLEVVQEVVRDAIEAGISTHLFGGHEYLTHAFWRHSVVVARVAELIREILRVDVSADIYLAGLLHDIGMLIVDDIEGDFYPQLMRESHGFSNLEQAEIEYVGASHSMVGYWFAEKIGLPEIYKNVIKFHHAPQKARENIIPICLVHLANIFTAKRGLCVGEPNLRRLDPLTSPAWTMIRRELRTFTEVNVGDFVPMIELEVDKIWDEVTSSVPL